MILILTYPEDLHFQAIEPILQRKKIPYFAYWFNEYPVKSSLSVELNKHQRNVFLKTETSEFNLSEVSSIWYRRPGKTLSSHPEKATRAYIENESQVFASSLMNLIPDVFWLSHPEKIKTAKDKLYQLHIASRIGFQIPHTVIGNNAEKIISAFEQYPEIVIKYFDQGVIHKDLNAWGKLKKTVHDILNAQVVQRYQNHPYLKLYYEYQESIYIYTKQVSRNGIKELASQLESCPVIVQNYIPKKLELRITVVGSKIYSCAIHSQETSGAGNVDWRLEGESVRHEPYTLPPAIEAKCFELVKRLGLEFGCLDMIVTPDGEYVFLEINPNGQWLWIQEKTGMPIAEAIVDLLVTRQGIQEQQLPTEPLTV